MLQSDPRSYLFVPGNRPDRFLKAYQTGADRVILDLEDAVPPSEKAAARNSVASWVSPDHPVLLRINGAATEWFREDLRLCAMPGVSGLLLPKTQDPDQIRAVRAGIPDPLRLFPMIETAQGFWNAVSIAKAPGVDRLLFGTIDFRADAGIPDEELLFFRSQLVLVSRIAGIQPPVDGVSIRIDDIRQLRADAQRARTLGFGGKLCIHPSQVPIVNESFLPSEEEVAWARRIVEAAGFSEGRALAVEGEMVDKPVLARARAILALVERAPTEPEAN